MPGGYLQCHYCGKKSNRKWTAHVRSWQCNYCEAFNYLDENGRITDPPVASANKLSSPQYGRYARSTQSPDLSPQGNNIFCKQCVTNQHFLQQNLAEYLPDSSHPEYNQYVRNYERYKKDLEIRYPQVCTDCAPRVNERLVATKYAARADHLRRGLEKTKPVGYTPNWQKWGFRRLLVFIGGVAWWASVLGQAVWHFLGVLPSTQEQLRLQSTSWYAKWTCALAAILSREVQDSCLEANSATAWYALEIGVLSFWWNNQLSKKLYTRVRRLSGVAGYLLIQLLSLIIRFAALYVLDHPVWIPEGVPSSGIHGAMLVFMIFMTLVSMTSVKLLAPPMPNFNDHRPIQVDSATTGPSYPSSAPVGVAEATSFSATFPISALSRKPQTIGATEQDSQLLQYHEDEENEMDWTPTGPSQYTQFNYQPPPEYRRPDGPNPFRGTLPPAPKPLAHKIRNPKPFIPASQEKKSNFMNQIRGEIRAKTGSPSDDEDDVFSFGGRRQGKAGFILGPGNMRDRQAENAASGLEDLFNSAFTINSRAPGDLPSKPEEKKEERGYVLDGETVRENVMFVRALTSAIALLVLCLALAIGMGWINPKAAIEALLYEEETVQEVHEVVEDFVQDYIGI